MAKRPPPDPRTGAGRHTRELIEALPATVTFQVRLFAHGLFVGGLAVASDLPRPTPLPDDQMVDMQAMTVSVHNPIKTEFMETFNAIYNPPPPPLMPLTAGEGGAEDDDLDIDAFDALPPLEDCFLPPDLLGDGALMEGVHGAAGGANATSGDDWDFGAALDFIFDKDKGQGGDGAGTPAPTTDSEWFGGGGGKGGAGAGAGNPPAGPPGSSSLGASGAASGAGGSVSPNAGAGLPGGGKMPAPSTAQQEGGGAGAGAGESPIRFMYEDALQRLRFEEFVKGFLSMSVFHTAECWVARGADTLEQVRRRLRSVCAC